MKKYDIAIIGAGCSGLSLAYRLLNTNLNICILESGNRENRTRKTWSYWNVYNHPFTKFEINSLDDINCVNNSNCVEIDCTKYNYKSIDSTLFDDFIFDKIDSSKNIDIYFASPVDHLTIENKYVQIKSNDKRIYAKEIYDSRPDNINASMYQVFLGYFIKPASPDSNIMPKLMDFTQDNEFSFHYVIPFDDNSCLVEYTFFTDIIKKIIKAPFTLISTVANKIVDMFKNFSIKESLNELKEKINDLAPKFFKRLLRGILPSPDFAKFEIPSNSVTDFLGIAGKGGDFNPIPKGVYQFAGINYDTGEIEGPKPSSRDVINLGRAGLQDNFFKARKEGDIERMEELIREAEDQRQNNIVINNAYNNQDQSQNSSSPTLFNDNISDAGAPAGAYVMGPS